VAHSTPLDGLIPDVRGTGSVDEVNIVSGVSFPLAETEDKSLCSTSVEP
jgi:hypothetical protein